MQRFSFGVMTDMASAKHELITEICGWSPQWSGEKFPLELKSFCDWNVQIRDKCALFLADLVLSMCFFG